MFGYGFIFGIAAPSLATPSKILRNHRATFNRSANKKILELESQLEELQTGSQEAENDELSNLRKEISTLRNQNRSLVTDVEQLRAKTEQQDEQIEESRMKLKKKKNLRSFINIFVNSQNGGIRS